MSLTLSIIVEAERTPVCRDAYVWAVRWSEPIPFSVCLRDRFLTTSGPGRGREHAVTDDPRSRRHGASSFPVFRRFGGRRIGVSTVTAATVAVVVRLVRRGHAAIALDVSAG